MTVFPVQPDFKDIEGLGPEAALRWVEAVTRGEIDSPTDFFWQGLADSTSWHADEAATRNDHDQSVAWGKLCLATLDWLEAHASSAESRRLFRSKALMAQARLIRRLGSSDHLDLLDPRVVLHRFEALVGDSPEAVAERLGRLRDGEGEKPFSELPDATRQEHWRLREIKTAARALKLLQEASLLAGDEEEEVARWLSVAERLP